MEISKKNASKKVVRKKRLKQYRKKECRLQYTKNKTKSLIYDWNLTAEFNSRKNISHYVNVRTNG